ncbi:PHD finger and BAH domain-containing protein [Coccidioides immitis RS]|uniref:PHD finger and BAH domain-containing protein n=1 Tax=Coccidioides immitis (strain RS) TaxID=246410 RepID=A0A0D8JXP3_COCIM|nr:PHD finger and BAH domain-containing protein [Coccidioides immitis RS]KJF61048.1 PHD finger and BAH domain-containing protein [Coccidioides immitis RS]TPX21450.1 putative PHD type zinc finger protein with BAH domain-containing protein [Coccidioides immitis]
MAAAQDAALSTESESPAKSAASLPTQSSSSKNGKMDNAADKAFAALNGSQSQPMTASTSCSSAADTPKQTLSSSTPTPAPYGTRSRNRVGVPRPNYAEDRDLDIDLEPVSNSKPTTSKKAASASHTTSRTSPAASIEKNGGVSTRGTRNAAGNHLSTTKEAIPGTSTFSANPNATNGSKKRKQPGSNTTVQGSSTPTSTSATSRKFIVPASKLPEMAAPTNMMTFNNSKGCLKNGKLKADDGTVLAPNDHVYLICEPPGEPYYLARIMEFLPNKDNPSGPIEMVRVNWYYRPRDIQRRVSDPRLVFASMHSDTCPLTALRGKCQIVHASEIKNLEEFRRGRNCFWFEKMYDRYIQRYYEVVPTRLVINVPQHVKKVLDERWKFILIEVGRSKEYTADVKTCKRCTQYAANSESVDCAVCHRTYHMRCVRPVLQKKPARGFAWACAPCSRAQDKKMEARNTPIIGELQQEPEPDAYEEDEEEPLPPAEITQSSSPSIHEGVTHSATPEQTAQAKLWPFRYLGIHCRVEEALEYDDRIYPRASSRIGSRHQANVIPWYGRPIRYVKAPEMKKKYLKSKKDPKMSKEALAAFEADKAERAKRPKWILDEPPGYIRRGEDEPITIGSKQVRTAELQFKMPDVSDLPARGEDDTPGSHLSPEDREKFMDEYMAEAKKIAPLKGIEEYSTNFLDKALKFLYEENFNKDAALARLGKINKYTDLKEPHLKPEEVKLFESGVAKYGSELRLVTKHVGTVPHSQIVRYYYMWKKTPKGRQIWGNFEGRRGKKALKKSDNATVKLVDDIADDHDDSAFDQDKAASKKRGFSCKFCSTKTSRRWCRAPFVPPGTTTTAEPSSKKDKGVVYTVALCQRCALLWRKYALQWENPDEVAKRISQGGTKSWRRKFEEELLGQLLTYTEWDMKINNTTATTAASLGIHVVSDMTRDTAAEPPKKKTKTSDKDSATPAKESPVDQVPKRRVVDKPTEPPPLLPEPPKPKMLPCAICNKMEPGGDQHLSCRDCRLSVHRGCYGVSANRNAAKWFCDTCSNDHNPAISTRYECVLCPVTWTEHELMEPPKISHKKKSDREREKERLEKEMVAEAIKLYRQRQEAAGKPAGPREALKRTAGNNWVHVTCAVWNPEIKFGNAKEFEPAEGMGLILPERFQETCKICKTQNGACVTCHLSSCNARFHVGCAHQAGYRFGFDVTPVKVSRRDSVNTMKLGEESGAVTAAIWCPHHVIPSIVHEMSEPSGVDDMNALQLYAQTCKQADLTLTGTVRKAAHFQQTVGASMSGQTASARRAAAANGASSGHARKESTNAAGSLVETSPKMDRGANHSSEQNGNEATNGVPDAKNCHHCQTTISPRWWRCCVSQELPGMASRQAPNGTSYDGVADEGDHRSSMVKTAEKVLYECHKCHYRKSESPAAPEPRPSPFVSKRDSSLPANRGPEYSHHSFASPRTQTVQQSPNLHIPPIVPLHPHGQEWRPDFEQRPGDYATPLLRNGIPPGPPGHPGPNGIPLPPPNFHSGPPQGSHMNGYAPSLPPPPSHYSGAVPPPPPHTYPTHQSPYTPVQGPSTSGPPQMPAGSHPYTSTSPPAIHYSPQPSMSGLAPGAPPVRMYPVERAIAPNLPSPSVSRRSVDPQPPGTPGASEQHNPGGTEPSSTNAPQRPPSSGRANSGNQAPVAASGASASPSLKNLLL